MHQEFGGVRIAIINEAPLINVAIMIKRALAPHGIVTSFISYLDVETDAPIKNRLGRLNVQALVTVNMREFQDNGLPIQAVKYALGVGMPIIPLDIDDPSDVDPGQSHALSRRNAIARKAAEHVITVLHCDARISLHRDAATAPR